MVGEDLKSEAKRCGGEKVESISTYYFLHKVLRYRTITAFLQDMENFLLSLVNLFLREKKAFLVHLFQ